MIWHTLSVQHYPNWICFFKCWKYTWLYCVNGYTSS